MDGLKEKTGELEKQLNLSQDQHETLEKKYDAEKQEWEDKV